MRVPLRPLNHPYLVNSSLQAVNNNPTIGVKGRALPLFLKAKLKFLFNHRGICGSQHKFYRVPFPDCLRAALKATNSRLFCPCYKFPKTTLRQSNQLESCSLQSFYSNPFIAFPNHFLSHYYLAFYLKGFPFFSCNFFICLFILIFGSLSKFSPLWSFSEAVLMNYSFVSCGCFVFAELNFLPVLIEGPTFPVAFTFTFTSGNF